MAERSFRGWLWTLALLGCLADQGSKYGVFSMLYNDGRGGEQAIIPGAFDLLAQYTQPSERELNATASTARTQLFIQPPQREEPPGPLARLRTISGEAMPRVNHGALFGMGGETGHLANNVFAVISFLAAAAIVFWSTRRSLARDRLLCTALGLMLGGTLGNLFDRLVFHGVRDFLRWHYAFEWPVFNIADCCLVVGAFLLLLQALATRPVTSDALAGQQIVESPVT